MAAGQGQQPKGVQFSSAPPAVAEIPGRSMVVGYTAYQDPSGNWVPVPVQSGHIRQANSQNAYEYMAAKQEARQELQKTPWERGYKFSHEVRKQTPVNRYNPSTGKGRRKKRTTRKKRSHKKWTSSATRRRN